jgi:ankyrin repeat protein
MIQKSNFSEERKSRFSLYSLLSFLLVGFLAVGAENTKQVQADSSAKAKQSSTTQKSNISQHALFDAALKGNLKKMQTALKKGLGVNSADKEGRTALMFAGYNGHTKIVRLLLKSGALINSRDAFGRTALIYAASGPNHQTVQLLLSKKADPDIVDKQEGWTALMYAAAEGRTRVVKTLLRFGADKTLKDADGETAPDFAAKNNHTEVVRLLQDGS